MKLSLAHVAVFTLIFTFVFANGEITNKFVETISIFIWFLGINFFTSLLLFISFKFSGSNEALEASIIKRKEEEYAEHNDTLSQTDKNDIIEQLHNSKNAVLANTVFIFFQIILAYSLIPYLTIPIDINANILILLNAISLAHWVLKHNSRLSNN